MNTMDARALRSLRGAVPDVRPPNKWIEPGQGCFCVLLSIVIAMEVSFLAWCLFFR